jgi:hypothetical protein
VALLESEEFSVRGDMLVRYPTAYARDESRYTTYLTSPAAHTVYHAVSSTWPIWQTHPDYSSHSFPAELSCTLFSTFSVPRQTAMSGPEAYCRGSITV